MPKTKLHASTQAPTFVAYPIEGGKDVTVNLHSIATVAEDLELCAILTLNDGRVIHTVQFIGVVLNDLRRAGFLSDYDMTQAVRALVSEAS